MEHQKNIIKANPNKAFFIEMLTRDISIERAIIDLIDNSIDGAKRLRPDGDLKGLWIKISIKPDRFLITDNCGGIPLNIAKEYAFCFGRPDEYSSELATTMKHGVGRFGVGMKRALFKIGKDFLVKSKNGLDHFSIKQDIKEWEKKKEWEFEFNFENSSELNSDGTFIEVKNVFENISEYFGSSTFINGLINEVGLTVGRNIEKGLKIEINGKELEAQTMKFYEIGDHKPIKIEKSYPLIRNGVRKVVKVVVFAGLGEQDPKSAGWYIYMNDRLVLARDKSPITGWRDQLNEDKDLAKYASKHAIFRGVVLFEADESEDLPMTTTKTGVDANHPIYKTARQEGMKEAMDQIFQLINSIGTISKAKMIFESKTEVVNQISIERLISNSSSYVEKLVYPPLAENTNSEFTRVSFQVKSTIIKSVKEFFKVRSENIAAEKAFEKFVKNNQLGDE